MPKHSNELERYNQARNTLSTLKNLSDFLAGIRGRRKAVVYFSEGSTTTRPIRSTNRYASDVRDEMQTGRGGDPGQRQHLQRRSPWRTSGTEDRSRSRPSRTDNSIRPTNLMEETAHPARQPARSRRNRPAGSRC